MKYVQKTLFAVLVAVLLVTSFVTPVAAAQDSSLTITNHADGYRYVVLTGPKTVTQMVYGGQSVNVSLPTGTYDYSYWGCGVQQTGTIRIKDSGNSLTIPTCADTVTTTAASTGPTNTSVTLAGGPAEDTGKLVVVNEIWDNIQLTVTGPTYAWLTVSQGRTTIDLPAGKYKIDYVACGLNESSSVDIRPDRSKTIKLQCDKQAYTKKSIGKVLVENHTNAPVRLIITSPIYQEVIINGPRLQIFLPWSDYTFYAFVDGNVISGTFEASKDQTTLKLYPTRYTFTTG